MVQAVRDDVKLVLRTKKLDFQPDFVAQLSLILQLNFHTDFVAQLSTWFCGSTFNWIMQLWNFSLKLQKWHPLFWSGGDLLPLQKGECSESWFVTLAHIYCHAHLLMLYNAARTSFDVHIHMYSLFCLHERACNHSVNIITTNRWTVKTRTLGHPTRVRPWTCFLLNRALDNDPLCKKHIIHHMVAKKQGLSPLFWTRTTCLILSMVDRSKFRQKGLWYSDRNVVKLEAVQNDIKLGSWTVMSLNYPVTAMSIN